MLANDMDIFEEFEVHHLREDVIEKLKEEKKKKRCSPGVMDGLPSYCMLDNRNYQKNLQHFGGMDFVKKKLYMFYDPQYK